MQSLWFGIAVAAVVVLTRQSRAATPAGLAAADGPKLCEKAFALTRLGEVGLEAARRVEALAQTARANAASIEALIAAASTQGEPGDAWDAQRDRARKKASGARSAAAALTLLANNATQQAMAAARTGADLSGFLLVLAAVGTGASSAAGRSCLKGDEQTITGGAVNTNAHYILAQTCASHFGLLAEKNFEALKQAVVKPVTLKQNGEGSPGHNIGTARQAGAEQCALLALSQTGTAGSNGLLIANGGTVNEDKTEKTTKKQTNKRITLGSCIEIKADSSGGIGWVDGTVKHGAKSSTDMLEKIEEALDASDKAKGPCAQHTGACEPINVAETLKALSAARAPKPNPANASMAEDTATSTSAQQQQERTRTAEQNRGRGETQRSPTPPAQVTEAVLRKSIAHAPLGLVALMTVQHATPH
ncbi:hypothetical protein, conserved in T. vivax [Trypanosoma vivax Y486]|uniref:Variant surface glycoprotein (VSG) n=1 Tax=Trypanosoma vivax (strain Y486) TaxID=1055687 RepID=F9WQL5_TRYVY|nr:hypothetical protein, conserved in T. vivax [Trypanosoma vivax Y486]|eukprot:CCD19843.1 hypothetical protein, conserved in T. vivax [Trypanosoma vivax Y486]